MFDPNAPLPDFASQQSEIERQRRMVEMLRKRAGGPMPEGQMVGRTYVAPHWAEFLPGLLDAYSANRAEGQARKAEKSYGEEVGKAQNEWASTLPRTVPGVEGRPELPGPRDEAGSLELDAVQAVPARLPSRDSVLKATMRGMQIPGNAKAAELWNKGMGEEITREDTQAARREETTARITAQKEARVAELEQKAEAARLRSEDTRLSIEQRKEAAAEMAAVRREAIAAAREAALLRAEISREKADKPKDLKNLPSAQTKAWTENNKAIKFIDDALSAVKAYPQGLGLTNVLGNTIRTRTDPKGVDVRALVGNIGSLKVHDRSGAAVTASETPRLVPFIPQPTDNAATVEKKLRLFQREYQLMQQEIVDLAETQGYKNPRIDPSNNDAAEETKTLNGVTYVKKNGQWFSR